MVPAGADDQTIATIDSARSQAEKELLDKKLSAQIICEIKDCQEPFLVICDEQINWFSLGWKPCDRKLCKHHFIDSSRCYSIPKTDCQLTFISKRKIRRLIWTIIFIFFVTGFGLGGYFTYKALKPPSIYVSPFYDVERKQNGDIYMDPLSGTAHD
jgi:hypothetical protein